MPPTQPQAASTNPGNGTPPSGNTDSSTNDTDDSSATANNPSNAQPTVSPIQPQAASTNLGNGTPSSGNTPSSTNNRGGSGATANNPSNAQPVGPPIQLQTPPSKPSLPALITNAMVQQVEGLKNSSNDITKLFADLLYKKLLKFRAGDNDVEEMLTLPFSGYSIKLTPLGLAIRLKSEEIVDALCQSGVDVHIVDSQAMTALETVCFSGSLPLIKKFMKVDSLWRLYDRQGGSKGNTYFMNAVMSKNLAAVQNVWETLKREGKPMGYDLLHSQLSTRNDDNYTPLLWAKAQRLHTIAAYLELQGFTE